MSFITLDFETYYDSKIKLGFKHQTTEEYIRDKRFEVIGVGVQVDDGEPEWYSGTHAEVGDYLRKLDWENSALLCHKDRKSTRLNSSHSQQSRMPSSA